ncbi:MAG: rRNA maturation RNase YbeY [Parcubacteria group bacterium]
MEKQLERSAKKIFEILGISGSRLEIFLVPNKVMRDINREYRGKDKETNILSFEAAEVPHPDSKLRHLGEIYLAPKFISAHNEDALRLLVHGILHLLGYDHERNTRAAKEMEKKEEEVMGKLSGNRASHGAQHGSRTRCRRGQH